MIEQRLEGPDDVNSAIEKLERGQAVLVVAGEVNRRPKSWLVQDVVQVAFEHGATVSQPHWVTRGLLRRSCHMNSCVLIPARGPGGDPAGVREPRVPRQPEPSLNQALRIPRVCSSSS